MTYKNEDDLKDQMSKINNLLKKHEILSNEIDKINSIIDQTVTIHYGFNGVYYVNITKQIHTLMFSDTIKEKTKAINKIETELNKYSDALEIKKQLL